MQVMHVIFNGINVNGRQIEQWRSKKKKKNELAFEIGLPVNETQFSKTTITKNGTFFI